MIIFPPDMGHGVQHTTMNATFTGISDNTDIPFYGTHSPTLAASASQKELQTTVCTPQLTILAQTLSTMSTSASSMTFPT